MLDVDHIIFHGELIVNTLHTLINLPLTSEYEYPQLFLFIITSVRKPTK